MKKICLSALTASVFLFLFLPCSQAAEPSSLLATRTEQPVTIDGVLDEAVWKTEGFSGFRQSTPEDGAPATEKTVVWIAYDDQYLYVAAHLFDSSPENIVSRLGRRDDEVESDWFAFAVDPYFDRRSGYVFAVNPAGSIMDGTLFNDEGIDMTWDGVWAWESLIGEDGWTVEIRIPYQQLHFKEKESYTWGVNFFRTIKRKNEECSYVWIPKEESGFVSRFAALTGIEGIRPKHQIEVLPFTLGRAQFSPAVEGHPFRTGEEFGGNAGFDLRATLKMNFSLNFTANPDFGQVEVDPAVINISDQETYYSEKRPFFIEGADIFRFGYGGANVVRNLGWREPRLFYSRRIGRSPQGQASGPGYSDEPEWTTILAAAKMTGKIGNGWNLGLLGALTEREFATVDLEGERSRQEIEPSATYGVLRTQKEFREGYQGLGFIATGMARNFQTEEMERRLPGSAFALAVDGWTFLDADKTWVVTGWFGGTVVGGEKAAITRLQTSSLHYFQRPDADYVEVDPEATSLSGWAGRIYLNRQKGNFVFNAALGAVSPGFHAMDLGYHTRGDSINGHIEAGYRSFHPGKFWRTWSLTLSTYRNYDFSGNRTDEFYNFTAVGQLLNYWRGSFFFSYDPPRYSHYLTRGGPMAYYPKGIMRRFSISSDNRKRLVLSLSGHYRTHPPYKGNNYSIDIGLRWKPSENLSLSVAPGYSWRLSEGQYITKVTDPLKTETYGVRYILSDIIQETVPIEIRISWTFTPRLSFQAYLQPYIGVGDYSRFKELKAARTFDFNYFGEGQSTIEFSGGVYTCDPDGPGPAEAISFRDPDFNLKSLRGTVVLRWEYRPGSAMYLVWTQNRADYSHPGDFNFERDFEDLLQAPGDHIFLFKINFRFAF
jgi:hypothetical protein